MVERKRFLYIHRLNVGVTYINMFSSYIAALLSICYFVFMDASQAFALSTYLNVPKDEQARKIGDIAFYSEIVILLTVHLWGTVSDKYGRRIVYVHGFAFIGVGFALYPLARTYPVLLLFRLIFAFGAAACAAMLTAVLGDYVYVDDRGQASGVLGLSAGGGACLGALVLLQVPNWLHGFGIRDLVAGETTYFGIAASAFIAAVLLWFGLKKHTKSTAVQKHNGVVQIMREGFTAGKNPVLALAYVSGFAARGDSAVATTFISFWVYQAATADGMSDSSALAHAGVVDGVAQTCALCFAPIAGIVCYKMPRVLAMMLLSALAAFGYIMICFSENPLGSWMMVGACIVGCGEIGLVVSSTALVAQEAPPLVRGSASGFFSFCGSIGIILANKVGSVLTGHKRYYAPFLMFGCFNVLLLILSVCVYVYQRSLPNTSSSSSDEKYKLLKSEAGLINTVADEPTFDDDVCQTPRGGPPQINSGGESPETALLT